MYFIYSLLLALGLLALSPKFLLAALRHGKYRQGLRERLGLLEKVDCATNPVVWIHCVSVGETQAARPLVIALRREFPAYRIVISTVTFTGQHLARQVFKDLAYRIVYFPFDWRWCVRRALRAVSPSIVLVMETELWPNFLDECARTGVRLAIVNGRLSERSYRRYCFAKGFITRVVNCLDLAVMQGSADAERMIGLGLNAERVKISGSIKFDADASPRSSALTEELQRRFGLVGGPVILAASTHSPEEQVILDAMRILVDRVKGARVIIAPRHPERFNDVAALINSMGSSCARRSADPAPNDVASDVILLDTIGELAAVFELASLVFVGGSIARTGGHNIIEPAAVGACIVTGANTQNFQEIVAAFVNADAVIQLPDLAEEDAATALAQTFADLLENEDRRHRLGSNAKRLTTLNQGATSRTISLLRNLFEADAGSSRVLASRQAQESTDLA